MRVLVIDDDIVYRNGISIAAKNRKWEPVACKDIETAKQIIQSEPPDLIISDCLLYDETVIDLLHWMKMHTNSSIHICSSLFLDCSVLFCLYIANIISNYSCLFICRTSKRNMSHVFCNTIFYFYSIS